MQRRPILAGNWKMNKTIPEAIELANGLKRELANITSLDIVVCPPFTALAEIADTIGDSNIKLGAQNMYFEEKGAFTGEISPLMLKDAGCEFVILGHSERRQIFRETNDTVNKKIKTALNFELSPIVCVGENLEERESSKTFDVVKDHMQGSLKELSKEQMQKIVIAYEPVWAIGTGKTATPAQAQEVHKYIRDQLKDMFDDLTANSIRIQYGGSIKPENIKEIMQQPDVDGGLVGGAGLKIDSYSAIIKNSLEVKQ